MSDTVPLSVSPSAPTNPAEREQFWRETIAAFTASGLSVRAFCRERGLHEKRFYSKRPADRFLACGVVRDRSEE